MRALADTDLLVFLYTLGRILFFSPRRLAQTKSRRSIPTTLEFEELSPGSLTDAQQKYLRAFDEKFAELNYQPTTTYRTTNLGKTLLRSYINPMEPVRAAVMIVEVKVNVNGVASNAHSCTLQFMTRFADGTSLLTRNMRRKSLFDNPPFRVTQECPRVSDPGELRRRHLLKMEKLNRSPLSAACDFASIVKELQEGHQRFAEYQLGRGAYRLSPLRDSYELTDKIHWRGIRNHFNPFLHLTRIPLWRFALAALFGIAAPVLTSIFIAPAAVSHARQLGLSPSLALELTRLSAYALAGAGVGCFVQSSNFLWSFILTYLGVAAVSGFHSYPFPYSTFSAAIAHLVAQYAKRKRLILQPAARPSVPVTTY